MMTIIGTILFVFFLACTINLLAKELYIAIHGEYDKHGYPIESKGFWGWWR